MLRSHLSKYRQLLVCAMIFSFGHEAHAIGIAATTSTISPKTESISITIDNPDDKSAHLITIAVAKIDSPYTANDIGRANEEILFSPSKLLLSPGQKAKISFNYKGPKDAKERYYAIKWQDEALSSSDHATEKVGQVMAVAKISTILLVQPRQAKFSAKYDAVKQVLFNDGNASLKAVAYGPCVKPSPQTQDRCQQIHYIGPGKQAGFKSVKLADKDATVGFWEDGDFKLVKKK